MKKFHCVFLFVIFMALQACNEKGEPKPVNEDFLTVTLDANYFVSEDMWVFATDGTGRVLDAGPVTQGTSLTLKTISPPEFVNLTTYYKGGGSPINHLFYTYGSIKTGGEIILKREQASSFLPSVKGKAIINIENCNPYTSIVLADGHAHSQFPTHDNTFVNANVDLRQDASNILVSSHKAMDEPVYGWVENVTNAGEYTLDFNSLIPFPKTISFSFSESMSALIIGRKTSSSDIGYVMANGGFSTISPVSLVAKFGYLDGFDEYRIFAASTKTFPNYYRVTSFTKHGTSLPQEITFPNNLFNIENELISNFAFNYSSTYTYHSHYWREDATDHTIHWRVYTDESTAPLITELPEALIAKYPDLSISNLTHSESAFFQHEDGYTYDQFLLGVFTGITPAARQLSGDIFQPR